MSPTEPNGYSESASPDVETVDGKRVVRVSTREAIVYDIGLNPRAE